MRMMHKPRRLVCVLPALLLVLAVVGCQAGQSGHGVGSKVAAEGQTVRICVQPAYSLQVMTQRYLPLTEYLEQETGYRMRVVSALSYNGYLTTLEGDQVDIGFQGPTAYVITAKCRGAKPLAQAVDMDGEGTYRGVIIVHQDSSIKSIQDLRGKTAMMVSNRSLGGYLAQRETALEHGVDIANDMILSTVPTEDVIIQSVYSKRVDAGFVREDALRAFAGYLDVSKIRVLATSKDYPGWVFASFRDTDPEVAAKVREALLKLRPDAVKPWPVLEAAQLAGFVDVQDKDYDIVRQTMDRLGVPY